MPVPKPEHLNLENTVFFTFFSYRGKPSIRTQIKSFLFYQRGMARLIPGVLSFLDPRKSFLMRIHNSAYRWEHTSLLLPTCNRWLTSSGPGPTCMVTSSEPTCSLVGSLRPTCSLTSGPGPTCSLTSGPGLTCSLLSWPGLTCSMTSGPDPTCSLTSSPDPTCSLTNGPGNSSLD